MEPLISIHNLKKSYPLGDGTAHEVLHGVNLDVEEGEFIAIMGRSGSGKSTFMNILGLLDRPSAGEYIFAGQPVDQMNDKNLDMMRNRKIGFIFQNFNLIQRRSVLDNVSMPLIYAGVPASRRTSMVSSYLELVGLKGYENRLPTQLSGGQQQRVAIARALVGGPSLILADEPTGNLDSTTAADIMELLKTINGSRITVIMVTHEHKIAEHADRVIHFKDGHVMDA